MKKLRLAGAFIATLLLCNCAAFGVAATSNPWKKLDDAHDLFVRQNRPIPAERLIQEAMSVFKEKDDVHGLGNTYREYALLLESAAVVKWEKIYRRDGFLDKSVTYDNRLEKTKEFYEISLNYFLRAEVQLQEAKKFDSLTNVYYLMSDVHVALGDRKAACIDLDHTVEAYRENMRLNPSAKPYGSVIESVNSQKRANACP